MSTDALPSRFVSLKIAFLELPTGLQVLAGLASLYFGAIVAFIGSWLLGVVLITVPMVVVLIAGYADSVMQQM